jgi:hypothetical protein
MNFVIPMIWLIDSAQQSTGAEKRADFQRLKGCKLPLLSSLAL